MSSGGINELGIEKLYTHIEVGSQEGEISGGAPGLRQRTSIKDRDTVLRPVVPAFWKSTES